MARQLQLFKLPPNPDFEIFWSKYPRKEAKLYARTVFERAIKSGAVRADQLVAAAERFARHVDGKDTQFIPLPATWINAGRWDDEYESKPASETSWKLNRAMEETMRRRMQ